MLRYAAGLILVSVILAIPARADGARIGADLSEFADGLSICTFDPFCTLLQTKTPGMATRSPFSGTITKWRAKDWEGTLALQVLRRKPGGEFKSIRSSAPITQTTSPGEIASAGTDLPIRKGDFVAIRAEDFTPAELAFADGVTGARAKEFVPGLADGETGPPTSSAPPGRMWLYDAKVAP